jgi:hypothetical protein
MRWADTTAGVMKMRNGANSAWITLYQLDGEWSTIAFENGTAGAPSIYFKDSGTDTGFYSPGANQVGISTGGTARLTIDSNGNVDIDSNTLYVDATNNRVGLGTSSPSTTLSVAGGISGTAGMNISGSGWGVLPYVANSLVIDNNAGEARFFATGANATTKGSFIFYNGETDGGTSAAMVIDTSSRVGIGTTSPGAPLSFADVNALKIQFNGNAANFYGISKLAGGGGLGDGEYRFTAGDVTGGAFTFKSGASERARIDSSGRLLVGTSSSSASARAVFQGNSFAGSQPGIIYLQRDTSSTGLTAGNAMGYIIFGDNAGANYAAIGCEADGSTGTNDYPARLTFSTTADGASSPTERMRITNDGNIYAGTTIPDGEANVFERNAPGSYSFVVRNSNTNNAVSTNGLKIVYSSVTPNDTNAFLACVDSTAGRITLKNNGGIDNYQSNNVNLCDEREKKNIELLDSTWSCLKNWELKKFHYNEDADTDDKRYGVIAQQVAEYCPEVITDWTKQKAKDAVLDENGNVVTPAQEEIIRMGVKEQQMMWMAIKALQEAQLRIENLEAEVAALKGV